MDPKRAKEIAASLSMVDVTHAGVPIYIESVSAVDETAVIHPLGQPGNHMKVEISNLKESIKT